MRTLDGIGRIDDPGRLKGIGEERDHLLPLALSHDDHGLEFGAPWAGCNASNAASAASAYMAW